MVATLIIHVRSRTHYSRSNSCRVRHLDHGWIEETLWNTKSLHAKVLVVAVRHLIGYSWHVRDDLVIIVVWTVGHLEDAGRKVLHHFLDHHVVKRRVDLGKVVSLLPLGW